VTTGAVFCRIGCVLTWPQLLDADSCYMPDASVPTSTASTGRVVRLHLVGNGGTVLEGGSLVVIGDVRLIGVTPGLVGTAGPVRVVMTGAFGWGRRRSC
jgi:hypothetical protein